MFYDLFNLVVIIFVPLCFILYNRNKVNSFYPFILLTLILFFFFLILFLHFIFCCMSAFQSPMRVHGDNIYVRHSNLMLEVCTGVVWWLRIRTTCFCVLWRHQNYSFLYTGLYCTAALSHSQALCPCMHVFVHVCGCLLITSSLNFGHFQVFSHFVKKLYMTRLHLSLFTPQPFEQLGWGNWTGMIWMIYKKKCCLKGTYYAFPAIQTFIYVFKTLDTCFTGCQRAISWDRCVLK